MRLLLPLVAASTLLVACSKPASPPSAEDAKPPAPTSAPAPAPSGADAAETLQTWIAGVEARLEHFMARFEELQPVIKLNLDEGLNKVAQIVDVNTAAIKQKLDELPNADPARVEELKKEIDILAETVDNMLNRGARMATELTRPQIPETTTSRPPN